MTKVNKSASGHVERIVPAIWILVFPLSLNPLQNAGHRLKLELAVDKVCDISVFNTCHCLLDLVQAQLRLYLELLSK